MDFLLDNQHDLVLDGNDLALTTSETETVQELGIRLQFFKGEWFLDITAGVPYLQDVLKKAVSVRAISALFKKEILSVPTVSELLEFELSYEDRSLRVDFKVMSSSGIITESIEVTI